jgi:GcrA cell cycle regulator
MVTGARVKPALSPPLRAEPAKPSPDSRSVALADLTLTTCRWPIGDPSDEGFRFCGVPASDPPYCNGHRRLAYHAARAPIISPANLNANNDE